VGNSVFVSDSSSFVYNSACLSVSLIKICSFIDGICYPCMAWTTCAKELRSSKVVACGQSRRTSMESVEYEFLDKIVVEI
jgi:hypothetical protein